MPLSILKYVVSRTPHACVSDQVLVVRKHHFRLYRDFNRSEQCVAPFASSSLLSLLGADLLIKSYYSIVLVIISLQFLYGSFLLGRVWRLADWRGRGVIQS